MNKKLLKFFIFFAAIFCYNFSLLSMSDDKRRFIKFQGRKETLSSFIRASMQNNEHPFSATPLIRYDRGRFIEQGDILTLDAHDMEDIKAINFVYCAFFRMQQTRLSKKEIPVGALILGTRDETIGRELQNSFMDSKMN